MGLDGLLRSRGDRFLGILNGLDTALWDPANDRVLAAPYSRRDPAGKMACRADLLTRNGMDPADTGPVIGMIGRLDPQKGFDLLAGAAPALLERGARLIVQGSGHASLADPFRALAEESPGKVAFIERFDREMARRIYAGADFFAMPSRFEPCGQGQMIALRYGTPPIVHRTGGLADTVIDVTRQPGAGTGFVFDEPTVEALLACVRGRVRAPGATGSRVGPAHRPRDGGRLRLDDGVRAQVSRRLPAGRGDPSRHLSQPRARSSAAMVSAGWSRWGEWGPPGIVMTWPAPMTASNAAAASALT